MVVKLITLNIQGDRNIKRVIPFLEKEKADVACLQEIFVSDFEEIRKKLAIKGYFCPMTYIDNKVYHERTEKEGPFGIAIMSKLICEKPKADYYSGDGTCPVLTSSGIIDRVLFHSGFYKNGQVFHIGTTHFEWTPDGRTSNRQRLAFRNLMSVLEDADDFVLCGDFNAPRGREIYNLFLEEGFKDNLPLDIKSTIDTKYHWNKNLELVVDTIFSRGKYNVSNVRVVDGLSDHKAVVGDISLNS